MDDLTTNLVGRLNVGDMLTRTAWRGPEKLAVVAGERRCTYAELNAATNRLANALAQAGYARGDVLGLVSGNSLEFLVTYYACAKLGVVCVPANLGWKAPELGYALQHSRARGVVVESQLLPLVHGAVDGLDAIGEIVVAPGTGEPWEPAGAPDHHALDAFVAGASAAEPEAYVEDRDALTYLYTSGTTSAPKGVVSSHLAVYVESLSAPLVLRLDHDDRAVAMMPLFHTAQLNGFTSGLIHMGGTTHLLRAFDPGVLLQTIEREGITQIFGLPMMYRALLEHPDVGTRDLSSLRLALYAMAPMPDTDLERAMEVLGCDFALGFGQTEMNPLTTIFRPEHQLSHPGSVGTAVHNVQVAIMDGDGTLLPRGESGEIVYRGPHAMEGYLRDEAATTAAFAGGWFHSGDVGHLDADGLLWFEDRRKDVIKTGGENVASIEVEKALYEAEPRIQDVVAIGLPHERWTEAITAVVVIEPGSGLTEQDVLDAAAGRLAGFKRPKRAVIVEEMPRTATGKIQKNVLRDTLQDLYAS
ncbi:unannotated protein [freshwater metagenome]|uniref:Unannotated protein n=1 Tax=freshwater metagenome TaxID=449393 RepID=A0A6J7JHK9_9ZZZZ|nr:AMP-binding protein [Actinomycetota bacterium]